MLRRWFGGSRFVFNQTVEYLQKPGTTANWKAIKGEILNGLPDWCKEVPYQIKSIAIKDACIAVSACKKKFKQDGKINHVKFRSRRDLVQSCYIPKSAVSDKGVFHTILGALSFKEALPQSFGDCRLVFAYGEYYLTVPYETLQQQAENQSRVVALDPGVRSFMTFFSESSFGWLGRSDFSRIQRLCSYLDRLLSRMSKARSQSKRRMRLAASRMRRKIRNLIDELHHKVAKFLVDNFDVILLPTFERSQMVSKSARKINSKTARQMMTFAHYRFKQFLKHKAFEFNKIVLDVCEAYTSLTVSWTGEIIPKLGGRKIIKSSDGRRMDRDLNGARGFSYGLW